MSDNINTLLVGTGNMAYEYGRVLKDFGKNTIVVGRSIENCKKFANKLDMQVFDGGITSFLSNNVFSFSDAIVAVDIQNLTAVCNELIDSGFKRILLEKPGALSRKGFTEICNNAKRNGSEVYIAFNRRFYASVIKTKELIKEDGGVSSFSFEFTEWNDRIDSSSHPMEVKQNWLLANSSHVIDLAFYLGGYPIKMDCYVTGTLPWHKNGCVYAGGGMTQTGALFSYQANWGAPGRWGIEILTSQRRFFLKPLEQLQVQRRNSVSIEPYKIEDRFDMDYKPGLYRQVQSFLNGDTKEMMKADEMLEHLNIYEKISGLIEKSI